MIEFSGPAGTFKKYSAVDVLTGAVPDNAFEKKIVLIGVTAPGAGGDTFVVPNGDSLTGLEVWSNHLENILSQRFLLRPTWAKKVEWALRGLAAISLVGFLPFIRASILIPFALGVF